MSQFKPKDFIPYHKTLISEMYDQNQYSFIHSLAANRQAKQQQRISMYYKEDRENTIIPLHIAFLQTKYNFLSKKVIWQNPELQNTIGYEKQVFNSIKSSSMLIDILGAKKVNHHLNNRKRGSTIVEKEQIRYISRTDLLKKRKEIKKGRSTLEVRASKRKITSLITKEISVSTPSEHSFSINNDENITTYRERLGRTKRALRVTKHSIRVLDRGIKKAEKLQNNEVLENPIEYGNKVIVEPVKTYAKRKATKYTIKFGSRIITKLIRLLKKLIVSLIKFLASIMGTILILSLPVIVIVSLITSIFGYGNDTNEFIKGYTKYIDSKNLLIADQIKKEAESNNTAAPSGMIDWKAILSITQAYFVTDSENGIEGAKEEFDFIDKLFSENIVYEFLVYEEKTEVCNTVNAQSDSAFGTGALIDEEGNILPPIIETQPETPENNELEQPDREQVVCSTRSDKFMLLKSYNLAEMITKINEKELFPINDGLLEIAETLYESDEILSAFDEDLFKVLGEGEGKLTTEIDGYLVRDIRPNNNDPLWYSNESPFYRAVDNTGHYLVNECTWYAFGRASEILGSNLEDVVGKGWFIGNAGTWFSDNYYLQQKGSGFDSCSDINSPKVGSIFVLTKNGLPGHVGIVEGVNDDGTINISEGGQWINGFRYSEHIRLDTAYPDYTFLGYIYLKK